MITIEVIGDHISGKKLVQRRSDQGVLLHKIGTEEYYADPIDVEDAPWEYEESDQPIPEEDSPQEPQVE